MQRLLLALVSALVLTSVAHSQTRELTTTGELLDRVAAVVNDGVVLQSELDEQVGAITERLQGQKQEMPPEKIGRASCRERVYLCV